MKMASYRLSEIGEVESGFFQCELFLSVMTFIKSETNYGPSVYNSYHITKRFIVQELCERGGGRPGLSVLTSLLVSVDVKLY